MNESLDLKVAQNIILSHVKPTEEESAPLHDVLGRIPAQSVKACKSIPAFPRSSMDGYAIKVKDIAHATPENRVELKITDEIPAGRVDIPKLKRGRAIRIMTGAMVPEGADCIIPLELCREKNGHAIFRNPGKLAANIRKTGSQLRKDQTIVNQGHPIGIEHLPPLAESGQFALKVYKRPRLAFLSTGSELLEVGPEPLAGQIISGNRFMIDGLTRQAGAEPVDLGLAEDNVAKIAAPLSSTHDVQIIVTTGGMGPGKYDLMKEVYARLGVGIIYDSLNVRPGRSTMFGKLGKILFFALPGPPPAGRLLFHELVRPALLALQGRALPINKPIKAYLNESIKLKKTGMENLKGGVFSYYRDNVIVRPARGTEPINCIICIPKNRKNLLNGEKVTLHLIQ